MRPHGINASDQGTADARKQVRQESPGLGGSHIVNGKNLLVRKALAFVKPDAPEHVFRHIIVLCRHIIHDFKISAGNDWLCLIA